MQTVIDSLTWIAGWVGIPALTVSALAWLLGGAKIAELLTQVLAILRPFFDIIAQALGPVGKSVGEGIVWVWQNVFWDGLKDIWDNKATIATVATMCLMVVGYMRASEGIRIGEKQAELNTCIAQLTKLKKAPPVLQQRTVKQPTFVWPWE